MTVSFDIAPGETDEKDHSPLHADSTKRTASKNS
jgi:hypothetical protein